MHQVRYLRFVSLLLNIGEPININSVFGILADRLTSAFHRTREPASVVKSCVYFRVNLLLETERRRHLNALDKILESLSVELGFVS